MGRRIQRHCCSVASYAYRKPNLLVGQLRHEFAVKHRLRTSGQRPATGSRQWELTTRASALLRARSRAGRAVRSPRRSASSRRRRSSPTVLSSRRPRPCAASARPYAIKKSAQGRGSGSRVVLERRGVALGLGPLASAQGCLHGVAVEPQVVVAHGALARGSPRLRPTLLDASRVLVVTARWPRIHGPAKLIPVSRLIAKARRSRSNASEQAALRPEDHRPFVEVLRFESLRAEASDEGQRALRVRLTRPNSPIVRNTRHAALCAIISARWWPTRAASSMAARLVSSAPGSR